MSPIIRAVAEPKEPLTERELEVVKLVADGASNKQIAAALFISENTVKAHLKSIFIKLEAESRAKVAAIAQRSGWVEHIAAPIGDGAARVFQLVKRYGTGASAFVRTIAKPVAGTVRVAVAGVEATGPAFSVDATTGVVTFAAVATPPAGAPVTAGFEFDVPVRFDTDRLTIDLAAFRAGDIPSIPLVEILP